MQAPIEGDQRPEGAVPPLMGGWNSSSGVSVYCGLICVKTLSEYLQAQSVGVGNETVLRSCSDHAN